MATINPSPYIGFFRTMVNVNSRFATYDFCYGYFQQNKGRLSNNMELSCYVLFSYLASWGMLRGSSPLLQYTPVALKSLVKYFDKHKDSYIWNLDVYDYTADKHRIRMIIASYNDIRHILMRIFKDSYSEEQGISDEDKLNKNRNGITSSHSVPTDTLVTKIMLGVFGVVPALDRYFQQAFHTLYPKISFNKLSKESINAILSFYRSNKPILDSIKIPVIDFTGKPTSLYYKVAKMIDMFGFMYGMAQQGKAHSQTTAKTSHP